MTRHSASVFQELDDIDGIKSTGKRFWDRETLNCDNLGSTDE